MFSFLFPWIVLAAFSSQPLAKETENELLALWGDVASDLDEEGRSWVRKNKLEEAALMEPTGPIPTGWPNVGIDIEKEMEKLPGGVAENVLTSGEGALYFFGGDPRFAEADWLLLHTGRERSAGERIKRGGLYSLTDRHLIFTGKIDRKIGKAYCWDSTGPLREYVKIYRTRAKSFENSNDIEIENMAFSIFKVASSVGTPPMCEVFFPAEKGSFTSMIYNINGEPLAGWVNTKRRYRIVPMDMLKKLTIDLKWKP